MEQKIIRIKTKMADPKGFLIPQGVIEQLTIEIADQAAVYYFKNPRITEKFAKFEIEGDKKRGLEPKTAYISRIKKAVVKYPGKSKEEIRDLILSQLNQLGLNLKKNKIKEK